jgi:hypothetical protein
MKKEILLILIGAAFSCSISAAQDPAPLEEKTATDTAMTSAASAGEVKSGARGEVTYVEGRARKQPLQSEEWLTAEKGSAVVSGDKVRTLRESRAELELMKLDIIRLAPMTTIDIVKLYEETKEGRDETQINVAQGNIWALVGKVKEDAEFNISTPVAGAAITGTRFRIEVEEDSSTLLKVYEGEVKITNAPGNKTLQPQALPHKERKQIEGPKQVKGPRQVSFEEWYYIVKNMQQIRIAKSGELVSSGAFSKDDADEQTEWVKWNLERDKKLGR